MRLRQLHRLGACRHQNAVSVRLQNPSYKVSKDYVIVRNQNATGRFFTLNPLVIWCCPSAVICGYLENGTSALIRECRLLANESTP